MENLYGAIASLGFPIVVAMFVLVRLNGKLDRLANAMTPLAERLDKHLASGIDEIC